jgi:hypothetical protein
MVILLRFLPGISLKHLSKGVFVDKVSHSSIFIDYSFSLCPYNYFMRVLNLPVTSWRSRFWIKRVKILD